MARRGAGEGSIYKRSDRNCAGAGTLRSATNRFVHGRVYAAFSALMLLCAPAHSAEPGATSDAITGLKLSCTIAGIALRSGGSPAVQNAAGYCYGLTEGASAALQVAGGLCVPEGVSKGDMTLAVADFIQKHPERVNTPGRQPGTVVVLALMERWGCEEPK